MTEIHPRILEFFARYLPEYPLAREADGCLTFLRAQPNALFRGVAVVPVDDAVLAVMVAVTYDPRWHPFGAQLPSLSTGLKNLLPDRSQMDSDGYHFANDDTAEGVAEVLTEIVRAFRTATPQYFAAAEAALRSHWLLQVGLRECRGLTPAECAELRVLLDECAEQPDLLRRHPAYARMEERLRAFCTRGVSVDIRGELQRLVRGCVTLAAHGELPPAEVLPGVREVVYLAEADGCRVPPSYLKLLEDVPSVDAPAFAGYAALAPENRRRR